MYYLLFVYSISFLYIAIYCMKVNTVCHYTVCFSLLLLYYGVVLLQSLDYIDYDTREVTFNKVVPQAYQVCTTLYYTVTLYMHYTVL